MISRTRGVNCLKKQYLAIKGVSGKYERTEIHSKEDRSIWELFKEFFNTIEIGGEFTRKEMFDACYDKSVSDSMRGCKTATPDAYRCYLKKIGLVDLVKPGRYKKLMNLPDLPIATIQKASKESNLWKEWFIPIHEKLGVDESELE